MSSGTATNPYAATEYMQSDKFAKDFGIGDGGQKGAFSLSPRQMRLNALWAHYRCQSYEGRKVAWDGTDYGTHLEHDQITTQGYLPNGFESNTALPVRFRRPTTPYYLTKIVVDRFTGLLFGERRSPSVVVEGDAAMTEWLAGLVEEGRLWAKMLHARRYGGAQGSVAISFSVVQGKPVFEPHDARWCTPVFADRSEMTLSALDKRYVFKDSLRDPETGEWIEGWFWYRRLITQEFDCEWPRVPVIDSEEPQWVQWKYKLVEHNLGVCPAVWVQNTPMDDDIDGDPDCQGAYELMSAYDQLMSQSHRAAMYNCNPTPWAATDDKLPQISLGTGDDMLQMSKGSQLQMLESSGSGVDKANELAEKLRERAFEICACVPENAAASSGGQATAFEVMTRMSRMLEQTDVFREQYGERGIKRLLQIAVIAARQMAKPRLVVEYDPVTDTNTLKNVAFSIALPPKVVQSDDGIVTLMPRELPPATLGQISLKWPRYFDPSLEDINKAVTAASTAVREGVIDVDTAVEFLKQYLPITDAKALTDKLAAQKASEVAFTDPAASSW
jgi:hypothetical protein